MYFSNSKTDSGYGLQICLQVEMKHMVVFATVTFLLDSKEVIWDKNMQKCQAK